MVLPTVGWTFLHQVLMKTVPHRCAPKVNMTWAIPQLRTPFHVTRGCVKLTKQTRTHISHRGQSRCCETYPNSIWQRGEIFVGPCSSKRWVLVLSWHPFASFFKFTLGCQSMGWYHPYERRVFSQLNLTGNSLADLGSTMALAVWYLISLTVKSTTTTTSRGLVTHTFRGFSSFDSAHPWSPRLALAQ